MTDVDARLTARLARLEAAIPAPPTPLPRVAGGVRRIGRPRTRTIALLAAAVLLLGVAGSLATVGANLPQYPDVPDPNVTAALQEAGLTGSDGFPAASCGSPDDAQRRIAASLQARGIRDWTIDVRPGVGDGIPCFYVDQIPTIHSIAIFPEPGPQAAEAVHAAAARLATDCLGRSVAFDLIGNALRGAGVTKFRLSANPWDPHGAPIGQGDAYQAHVNAGCFVYAGSGGDADGTLVYYLWGPWP